MPPLESSFLFLFAVFLFVVRIVRHTAARELSLGQTRNGVEEKEDRKKAEKKVSNGSVISCFQL